MTSLPITAFAFVFVFGVFFFDKLTLVHKRRKWNERPWCYIVSSESSPKFSEIFMFLSVFEYYYQTTCVDLQSACRTASLKGQSVSTVPGAQKQCCSFRRWLALGQTTLSQWSCSPDVPGIFFFKFKFPKGGKGFVLKIWFYLRHLHPGVHFINCPHIFPSRELNWL